MKYNEIVFQKIRVATCQVDMETTSDFCVGAVWYVDFQPDSNLKFDRLLVLDLSVGVMKLYPSCMGLALRNPNNVIGSLFKAQSLTFLCCLFLECMVSLSARLDCLHGV